MAVVVGTGEAARSRARMLEREGAHVVRTGARRKGRRTVDPVEVIRRSRPQVVFLTTWNGKETEAIVRAAHRSGSLVHVYDTPERSDFTMPSIGEAGPIRFAVSTAGHSPAMAVLLRHRMQRAIRPVDVARVRLQGRIRSSILRSIPTHERRREAIYRILRNRDVGRLLREGRFEDAVAAARHIVSAYSRTKSATPKTS